MDRNDSAKSGTLDPAAIGAGNEETSRPPSAAPPVWAADRLPSSALLPPTSWSRFTKRTRDA
jgi:hypothetical protein